MKSDDQKLVHVLGGAVAAMHEHAERLNNQLADSMEEVKSLRDALSLDDWQIRRHFQEFGLQLLIPEGADPLRILIEQHASTLNKLNESAEPETSAVTDSENTKRF